MIDDWNRRIPAGIDIRCKPKSIVDAKFVSFDVNKRKKLYHLEITYENGRRERLIQFLNKSDTTNIDLNKFIGLNRSEAMKILFHE